MVVGENHGRTARGSLPQEISHALGSRRIDARERFIANEHPGFAEKRSRQLEATALTAR